MKISKPHSLNTIALCSFVGTKTFSAHHLSAVITDGARASARGGVGALAHPGHLVHRSLFVSTAPDSVEPCESTTLPSPLRVVEVMAVMPKRRNPTNRMSDQASASLLALARSNISSPLLLPLEACLYVRNPMVPWCISKQATLPLA